MTDTRTTTETTILRTAADALAIAISRLEHSPSCSKSDMQECDCEIGNVISTVQDAKYKIDHRVSSKLKPCRLCGAEALIMASDPNYFFVMGSQTYICSKNRLLRTPGDCGGDVYLTEAAWNQTDENETLTLQTFEIEYDGSDGSCTVCFQDGRYYTIFQDGRLVAAKTETDRSPIGYSHRDLFEDFRTEARFVSFQRRVNNWIHQCFGRAITEDPAERNRRFIEESLELVQALNMSREEAHWMVDYVFNRPIGEVSQEVGGVMVCLAALCNRHGIDIVTSSETELARIGPMSDKIRNKQAAKPKYPDKLKSQGSISPPVNFSSLKDRVFKFWK